MLCAYLSYINYDCLYSSTFYSHNFYDMTVDLLHRRDLKSDVTTVNFSFKLRPKRKENKGKRTMIYSKEKDIELIRKKNKVKNVDDNYLKYTIVLKLIKLFSNSFDPPTVSFNLIGSFFWVVQSNIVQALLSYPCIL